MLDEYQVYEKLKHAKKPNSTVKGDIPVGIVKEFYVELAEPVTRIFNKITSSAEYPRQWVRESQVALVKSYPLVDEDSLRLISKTAFFSKAYEGFLRDWLMPIVGPFLDPSNYGGFKGGSTVHYMLKLLHYIHNNVYKIKPHAVMLALAGCLEQSLKLFP